MPVNTTSGSTTREPKTFREKFANVTGPMEDLRTMSDLMLSLVYSSHVKSALVMVTSVSVVRSTASNSAHVPTSMALAEGFRVMVAAKMAATKRLRARAIIVNVGVGQTRVVYSAV